MKLKLAIALGPLAAALGHSQDSYPEIPDRVVNNGVSFVSVGYYGELKDVHHVYLIGDSRITRTRCERASASGSWTCWNEELTASFSITGVESIEGGKVVFVSGLKSDGSVTLERWTFPERDGGWRTTTSHYLPAPVATGGVVPAPQVTLTVQGGGAWSPPDLSGTRGAPDRVAYDDLGLGSLSAMAADPQGRYLCGIDHSTASVVQVTFPGGGLPPVMQPLFSETELTGIGELKSLEVWDFQGEGRKLLVRGEKEIPGFGPSETFAVIPDVDNDGAFEVNAVDAVFGTEIEFLASTYGDSGLWDKFFIE
ncbi:MAG: hypothetical protein AAFZ65_01335 [Planctomycetota bacterium]